MVCYNTRVYNTENTYTSPAPSHRSSHNFSVFFLPSLCTSFIFQFCYLWACFSLPTACIVIFERTVHTHTTHSQINELFIKFRIFCCCCRAVIIFYLCVWCVFACFVENTQEDFRCSPADGECRNHFFFCVCVCVCGQSQNRRFG